MRSDRVRGVGNRTSVETDHRDRRLGPHAGGDVARARELQPVDHAGGRAQLLLRPIHVRVVRATQTRNGDVTQLVEQRGDEHRRNGDGVKQRAAESARVHRVVGNGHVDGHNRVAAQGRGNGWLADLPVRRVRHNDDVGGELILVGVEERGERRRTDLFLALDEHDDVDRQVLAEDRQRTEVDRDAGAVVRGTAAVDAVAANLGLVGIHAPAAQLAHRLHVVVRVQQDGRRALNVRRVRDEGGLALGTIRSGLAQHLGLQAEGGETLADVLSAAFHVGRVCGIRRHRRNRDELRELLQQGRESSLQALLQNGRGQCM